MSYDSLYKLYVLNNNDVFNKIYNNRFNSESTIHLPFTINKNPSFFFLHKDISNQIEKLTCLKYEVNELFTSLPEASLTQYIKKSLIDEIYFTNEIEGIISTRQEIHDVIDDLSRKDKNKRFSSIINKYKLLIDGIDIPLNESKDIRNLYDELLYKEVIKDDLKNELDGELFRKEMVYLKGSGDRILHKGVYPEEEIISQCNKLLNLINSNIFTNDYIKTAVFHYIFAYIHPFYDGNGRLNRFISSFLLSKTHSKIIAYRLSSTIKENHSQYLKAFDHTNDPRNKGDISTFVYEFLDILIKSYENTKIYLLDKIDIYEKYKIKINKLNITKTAKKIINVLIQSDLFSLLPLNINQLQDISKLKLSSCNKALKELNDLNLLNKELYKSLKLYSVKLENL